MRGSFCAIVILIIIGCSTGKNRPDVFISIKLMYPVYPWEQFTIRIQGDSNYFEFQKLYHAIDSNYQLPSNAKLIYQRVVEQHIPHFLTVKTMQTDSIYPSEIAFAKDTATNKLIILEKSKTKWTLIDSITVSEVMYSYRKKLSKSDLSKAIDLVEQLTSKQQKETKPCLDGTTIVLAYRKNQFVSHHREFSNCVSHEPLEALVNFCKKQSQ